MADKYLAVKFSDGRVFLIPARFIAEHRARYYAALDSERGYDFQAVYDAEISLALTDTGEILDWAFNNMDWIGVRDVALLSRCDGVPADYDAEWTNVVRWIEEE